MKIPPADTPKLTDALAREKTGKTLKDWFAAIDQACKPESGRRDRQQWVYDQGGLKDAWWLTVVIVEHERAQGIVEKDGRPKGYSICATKTLAASPAEVSKAWSDARLLSRWLGPGAKASFADGGALETEDGDKLAIRKARPGKDVKGSYAHAALAGEIPCEVMFQAKGAKTTVLVNLERIETRAAADQLRLAWGEALGRLKDLLEAS